MPSSSSKVRIRRSRANSLESLQGISRASITLCDDELEERKEFLWNAMLTEFDAVNLVSYLTAATSTFSDAFIEFMLAWQRDEWNHYVGFREVYSTIYSESKQAIEETLEGDHGNFEAIRQFLEDEFKICLLIAYDEIATFKSYLAELPFYTSFGDERIVRWFRRVTNEELNHFQNCMDVIASEHGAKIRDLAPAIDELIRWDTSHQGYERTFVLDHYWYSREFLEHCGSVMKRYLISGLKGENFATRIEVRPTEKFFKRYTYNIDH